MGAEKLLADVLVESMSPDHYAVIDKLSKPKHDEDLATELNIKATLVRTLLNDLHIQSLVEYERTKNKKTGWYTYVWKRREDKIDSYIKNYLASKLDMMNRQLDLEKDGLKFSCGCSKVTIEKAMETNFICTDCKERYNETDNSKIIKKLESEIKKLRKHIDN